MKNGYNFDPMSNTLTISTSFAKKASKVGSLEYNIILRMRRDFPNLTIQQEAKKEGKKALNYHKMEEFIGMHRDVNELLALFEKVKKLSHIQPMPYKYVRTWFEDRFPYYENPAIDDDGFVVDPVTLNNLKDMVQEVTAANQQQTIETVLVDKEDAA